WAWVIRVKSEKLVTKASGRTLSVQAYAKPPEQAYLFKEVTVLGDLDCHLATAHVPIAEDPWAVKSRQPPSLKTKELYGKRNGCIEPHFKDYKSAAFDILRSGLRDEKGLTCLVMLQG
ncbi:MAG: IS4 family transposase, partial [Moorea sp. SIO2I5]|nr:IS4 family transposase [Moorena sp. SIO2I5]